MENWISSEVQISNPKILTLPHWQTIFLISLNTTRSKHIKITCFSSCWEEKISMLNCLFNTVVLLQGCKLWKNVWVVVFDGFTNNIVEYIMYKLGNVNLCTAYNFIAFPFSLFRVTVPHTDQNGKYIVHVICFMQ